jgi:hypothetical protein
MLYSIQLHTRKYFNYYQIYHNVVPMLYPKRKEALSAKIRASFSSSGEQDRTADLRVMNPAL